MADEKKYTERDATKRERAAFVKGALNQFDAGWPEGYGPGGRDALARHFRTFADAKYPLPKVTRPRVVTDADGDRYRVIDGVLQVAGAYSAEDWRTVTRYIAISPAFVRPLADLLANPTETVEDDA